MSASRELNGRFRDVGPTASGQSESSPIDRGQFGWKPPAPGHFGTFETLESALESGRSCATGLCKFACRDSASGSFSRSVGSIVEGHRSERCRVWPLGRVFSG
jgi:hypothetical protein